MGKNKKSLWIVAISIFMVLVAMQFHYPSYTAQAASDSLLDQSYPAVPRHTQKHYIIYTEGYRNNRLELALFDVKNDVYTHVVWKKSLELDDNSLYTNGSKFHLSEDKTEWIPFENGYPRISDFAENVLQSDLDIYKDGDLYIAGRPILVDESSQSVIRPVNGSVFGNSDITVSWNKASWAQKYKVTVEDLESYQYVFSKEFNATSITINKSSFKNWHQYKIWVAGIDKNGIQQSLGNPVIWVRQNIKQGDSGDFVAKIQKRLIGKGYALSHGADGKFDSKTTAAVNSFKKDNNLLNTGDYAGVVGKDTWYKLNTGVWLVYGSKGDMIAKLQKMLVSLKYTTAANDKSTNFGKGILNAVNKFKNDNKIYNKGEMNGVVGDQVWNLLVKKSTNTDLGVQVVNKSKNAVNYIKDLVKQGKASPFYSTTIYGRRYNVYKVTGAYITESKSGPCGFTLSTNPKYRPSENWKAKNHGYYFVDAKSNTLVTNTDIIKKLEIMQNANFEFLLNMQLKKVGGDPFTQMLNDIRQTRNIRESSDFWKTWCDVCSSLTGNIIASYVTGGLGEARALTKTTVESIADVAQSKITPKTLIHGVCTGVFNTCENNICSLKTLHEKYEKYGYINDYNDAQLYLKYGTYMKVYYATSMFDDNVGGYTQDFGWWDYTKDTWGNFIGGMVSSAKEIKNVADWEKRVAIFFEGVKMGQDIFQAMGVLDIQCADDYVKQVNTYFKNTHAELNPDYFDSLTYKLVNDGQSVLKITNQSNRHQYALINETMPWDKAKAYCENLGGHLATITTKQEQDFIESLIGNSTKSFYWLGGTDEAHEGDWKWVTGESFDYSNWVPGEPNNGYSGTEHYLGIVKDSIYWSDAFGKWNDFQNGNSREFPITGIICEWDTN